MKVVAVAGQPCYDCGARIGKQHKDGCDIARCILNGEQRLQHELFGWNGRCEDGCEADIWTGKWPGQQQCEDWGWYSVMVEGQGWVACLSSTPGASADLNRLHTDAYWDSVTRKWIRN